MDVVFVFVGRLWAHISWCDCSSSGSSPANMCTPPRSIQILDSGRSSWGWSGVWPKWGDCRMYFVCLGFGWVENAKFMLQDLCKWSLAQFPRITFSKNSWARRRNDSNQQTQILAASSSAASSDIYEVVGIRPQIKYLSAILSTVVFVCPPTQLPNHQRTRTQSLTQGDSCPRPFIHPSVRPFVQDMEQRTLWSDCRDLKVGSVERPGWFWWWLWWWRRWQSATSNGLILGE